MNKLLFLIAFIPFSILAQGTLTVQNGGTLTIEKEANVTAENLVIATGDKLILNSDSKKFASLIVTATSSGKITYNRHVNKEGAHQWDLIGAPVKDLDISEFLTTNSNSIARIGSIYGLGTYSNNEEASTVSPWTYELISGTNNGTFFNGIGYAMATRGQATGQGVGRTMQFTGSLELAAVILDLDNYTIQADNDNAQWHLVANPYPSYLRLNSAASPGSEENFMTENNALFATNSVGVYAYTGAETTTESDNPALYTALNNSSGAMYIAPGQGFFIKTIAGNTDVAIKFTPAMQTHVPGSDDFVTGKGNNTSYELVLEMYNNTDEIGSTKLYFKEGLTLGLDPGYDAGAFRQITPISTRLVEEDQGINFSINAMSDADINSTTIPLVLNQGAGQVISIGIASNSLSEDVNVYLEDTLNSTITLLQENNFELTTQSAISEAGRFYIHLTTSVLANEDVLNNSLVNMYKGIGNNFITIEGLRDEASIKLYDILGKQVRTKVLSASNETLSTIGLSSGIYIIQLKSNNQILTKKVQID